MKSRLRRLALFNSWMVGLLAAGVASAASQNEKAMVDWHAAMSKLKHPKADACFTATFPKIEWKEVPCAPTPNIPAPPRPGHLRPVGATVGGGGATDFSAVAAGGGHLSSADGSFTSISTGATETGQVAGVGGQVSNAYTLQLNTNPTLVSATACAGAGPAGVFGGCVGWEQFIYQNDGGTTTNGKAYIQYWMLNFNKACPAGWIFFNSGLPAGVSDCFHNSSNNGSMAMQPVGNLTNLILEGKCDATSDGVTLFVGGTAFAKSGTNDLSVSASWTDAEFNLFGDLASGVANFGANTTIGVKTVTHSGTTSAPTCTLESFTGETSNLTLVGTAAVTTTPPSPEIVFTESNTPGTAASCASANGLGDVHLTTFLGLLYDFQAAGDFVLAETGPAVAPPPSVNPRSAALPPAPGIVVQTRQVSGAPRWPSATVNKAVAARVGKTTVALCLPGRLVVDGKTTDLADGKSLSLAGNSVLVSRAGNVYLVGGLSGDSMRAQLNDGWIDVTVGLGRWPENVRGLLANAPNDVNQIQARDGAMLSNPFPFDQLYHHYADSWRVPANESLLSVCDKKSVSGVPREPFYAQQLEPKDYKHARAVCEEVHVKDKALLDACTLDVAVIGKDAAAKAFVNAREPVAVGRPTTGKDGDKDHDKDHDKDKDKDRR